MKEPVSTTNACRLCQPLGACLAFRGIEAAVPFLHGSQGCATYMRRYIISHFGEPMDIASSSLGEEHAVFGGAPNLKQGLINVMMKYAPALVGVATTCLTETIGDDVGMILKEFRQEYLTKDEPIIVNASTPSYAGSHYEGFHQAVKDTVDALAATADQGWTEGPWVNLFCGMVSPQDIRHLKEIFSAFGLTPLVMPDVSETLDGPVLRQYPRIPRGGSPIQGIRAMDKALCSIQLGSCVPTGLSAANLLNERFGLHAYILPLPVGIAATDRLIALLEEITGRQLPVELEAERGRLVDAMVDGHKYLFGLKALVHGDEDLVSGLCSFLCEVGVRPVICATGGKGIGLEKEMRRITTPHLGSFLEASPLVMTGVDFHEMEQKAKELGVELVIGSSKGYKMARSLRVPLIRVGFPIHDRLGGQRLLHLGYRGAQRLFDELVNTVIASRQEASEVGYWYF